MLHTECHYQFVWKIGCVCAPFFTFNFTDFLLLISDSFARCENFWLFCVFSFIYQSILVFILPIFVNTPRETNKKSEGTSKQQKCSHTISFLQRVTMTWKQENRFSFSSAILEKENWGRKKNHVRVYSRHIVSFCLSFFWRAFCCAAKQIFVFDVEQTKKPNRADNTQWEREIWSDKRMCVCAQLLSNWRRKRRLKYEERKFFLRHL